jgi:hypothetical protein
MLAIKKLSLVKRDMDFTVKGESTGSLSLQHPMWQEEDYIALNFI